MKQASQNAICFINPAQTRTRMFPSESGAWAVIYCPRTQTFLFGKRSSAVNKAGAWNLFGGRLDGDEAPVGGLIRELEEEAGIYIGPEQLRELACLSRFRSKDANIRRDLYYFALRMDSSFIPILNYEHSEYHWFRLDELPERVNSPTRLALEAHLLERARACCDAP